MHNKHYYFLVFIATLFFARSAFAQSCTGNMLTNPGFESSFTDWSNPDGATIVTDAHSGTKAINLCLASGTSRVFQTKSITPGTSYTFKAWGKRTQTGQVNIFLKFMTSGYVPISTDYMPFETTTYTEKSIIKTAPATAAFVEVGFIQNGGQGCLTADDACLTAGTSNPCSPDVTAPVFALCPSNISVTTAASSTTVNWTAPTATDACPGTVTITSTKQPGAVFPVGSTNVVYTATDAAGNQANCSFTVTVINSSTCTMAATAANILCNNNGTATIATDDVFSFDLTVTGTGTCGTTWGVTGSPATNYNSSRSFGPFAIANGAKTVTIYDVTYPTNTITYTVNPPATCSGGGGTTGCASNLLQNPGFESGLTSWQGNGGTISTDASAGTKALSLCQNNDIRQTLATTAGKTLTLLFKAKTTTSGSKVLSYIKYMNASWTPLVTEFFDYAGTSAYVQATVTKTAPTGAVWVEIGFLKQNSGCILIDEVCLSEGSAPSPCSPDVTAPVFSSCPANISLSTAGTTATATWTAPTATDACPGTVTITGTHTSGASFPLGTTTVTYTAKDAANNQSTCTFTVTVTQTSSGVCSFLKSYFPYDPTNNIAYINTLAETATGLEASYVRSEPSVGFKVTTVKTDGQGNLSSTVITLSTGVDYVQHKSIMRLPTGEVIFATTDATKTKPVFTKINAAGTVVWTKLISQYVPTGAGTFMSNSIISDGTGFIGAFTLTDNTASPVLGEVIYIKIDANGNFQWQKKTNHFYWFPTASLAAVSSDAFYAAVTDGSVSPATLNLNKYNKTNGNLIWSTPISTLQYGFISLVLSGTNSLMLGTYNYAETAVSRVNATTGVIENTVLLANFTSLAPFSVDMTGMVPTSDGGVIIGARYLESYATPTSIKYMKLNSSLGLVWSKDLPTGWDFGPKAIAADGGILFLGTRGLDFSILKTTATGERTPACANSCSITDVAVSNITCNNNGTLTNALDDTYSFSANVTNGGGCTSSWTSGGTTGSYGVNKTVSGFLIDDGLKTVTFADAANPTSTVFSIKVTPPAFCSNSATGCGFDKTYATSIVGNLFQAPVVEKLSNGGYKIKGKDSNLAVYRELTIDATGLQTNLLEEAYTGTKTRTLDGYFIGASFSTNSNIVLTKTNGSGSNVIFTKNVAFAANTPVTFYGQPMVTHVLSVADGYVLLGYYDNQLVSGQAPVRYPFILKTDLNGVKVFQNVLPVYEYYPDGNITFLQGASGSFYYMSLKSNYAYVLHKVNATGTELWKVDVLGDLPSSYQISVHESSDGHVFTTRYDNLFGYVKKLNGSTGATLWEYSSDNLPIPDLSATIFGTPYGSIATADGGAIFSMLYSTPGFSNPGFVMGRLSPNGHLVWHKTLGTEYAEQPIAYTADGGFLFAGTKNSTSYGVMKTNSLGELTPACGGSTPLPDLNMTNLSITNPSVAAGSVLNFKFDLKNTGTGNATGSFTVKAYISTDNVWSANDIQDGVIPTGNLNAGATVAQVMGGSTVPATLAAGNYYLILRVDADGQITESNENNNTLVSTTPFQVTTSGGGGGGTGADLQVTMTADKTTVPQWSNVTYTVRAKNNGTVAISSAAIRVEVCPAVGGTTQFYNASGLVYANTPGAPTMGTYNFIDQIWTLTNLAPGQEGVLTFTLFTLTTAERKVVAYSKSQSPTDPDSQPSATAPVGCTPGQDDEAVWTINLGQSLQSGTVRSQGPLEADQVDDFQIFPNPVGDNLYLDLSAWKGKTAQITFLNQLGQPVFEKEIPQVSEFIETIDMTSFNNGQYFVRMQTEGQRVVVKRLVVSRLY